MNEEIQLHLAKANDCIKDAELLLTAHRSSASVGRSYYAMFHAASALLSGKDIKRHSHQGLISAFGQFFVKPGNIEPKFHKQACLKGKKTSAKDDFCTMCGKNWCSLRINKELAKIHSKK